MMYQESTSESLSLTMVENELLFDEGEKAWERERVIGERKENCDKRKSNWERVNRGKKEYVIASFSPLVYLKCVVPLYQLFQNVLVIRLLIRVGILQMLGPKIDF
jgi:hypothetical protein